MNKNVFFSFLIIFITVPLPAQVVIQNNNLEYKFDRFETPGFSEENPDLPALRSKITQLFHAFRREGKLNPLEFEPAITKIVGMLVEITPVISGDLEAIQAEAKKHPYSSWLWGEIDWSDVSVDIKLSPSGLGVVYLKSKKGVVGMTRCSSSNIRKVGEDGCQPNGNYTFAGKMKSDIEHVNHEGTLMEYARCFESTRGLYTHLGQITANSSGCLRFSRFWSSMMYQNLEKGTKLTVQWLDEG